MSRYIDLDNPKIYKMGRDKFGNAIYHIPPDTPLADVREVVHGEWIKYGDKYKCNKCFATMPVNPINPSLKDRFCYFCGANMQKGETNE